MSSSQQHSEAFAPVLSALDSMKSNGSRQQKAQAHDYLEKFQKSVRCIIHPEIWHGLKEETVGSLERYP